MTNHIAKIICDTDLPNSNGFGTVRLNKKEAEILAAKLVSGLYPQDNLVADFEQQLKTEKAKYFPLLSNVIATYTINCNESKRASSILYGAKQKTVSSPKSDKKYYVSVRVQE
jgi:hypothetical protein